MTREELITIYQKFVESDIKRLAWDNQQIEWHNKYIKQYRQEDKEFIEYIWSKGVVTEFEMKHFNKGYKSNDMRYHLRQRDYYYRDRKKAVESIEKYKKELERLRA